MSRIAGRPPLPPEERKSAVLTLRVGGADRTDFEAAARHFGMTLSDWMRSRLSAAARRDLRPAADMQGGG